MDSSLFCSYTVQMSEISELLAVTLVAYGKFLAALSTTRSQYAATVGGGHSLTETMLVVPSAVVGLECSFHCLMSFLLFLITVSGCKIKDFF